MGKVRVVDLKPGEKIVGNGTVKEVKDFGNRVIVDSEEGGSDNYGAYDEVDVED